MTIYRSSLHFPLYGFTTVNLGVSLLTPMELKYLNQLIALNLASIRDGGIGENTCRQIGENIFETFKKEGGDDSQAGITAMQNVCKAILTCCLDGTIRTRYVSMAWNGVGDQNEYWLA